MAPTRRPSKSKYTADRGIPGAFEGETVTRRRFMTGTAHGAGALATMGFALPALAFAIGPIFKNATLGWQTVGTPDMFPDDNYIPAVIVIAPGIGEAGNSTVYIRKRNPAVDTTPPSKYNQWVAISTRCAHLGCPVRWVLAAERFICPCHGGVYDLQGVRVGGPPPRPLDRFLFEAVVIHLLRDHRRDQPAQHLDELPLLLGVYGAFAGSFQIDAQFPWIWLRHRFEPEIAERCRPAGAIQVNRDLAGRRRAEEKLRTGGRAEVSGRGFGLDQCAAGSPGAQAPEGSRCQINGLRDSGAARPARRDRERVVRGAH